LKSYVFIDGHSAQPVDPRLGVPPGYRDRDALGCLPGGRAGGLKSVRELAVSLLHLPVSASTCTTNAATFVPFAVTRRRCSRTSLGYSTMTQSYALCAPLGAMLSRTLRGLCARARYRWSSLAER